MKPFEDLIMGKILTILSKNGRDFLSLLFNR